MNQPVSCPHGQWDARTDICVICGITYAEWLASLQVDLDGMAPYSLFEDLECKCEQLLRGHEPGCPEKKD